MNILVCMKQVQDNAVAPKLDPATGRVVTQGVETMVSPFDLNALEAGLKLAEEHGGEVSVLAMGDEESKITLRIGSSMGAGKAYLAERSGTKILIRGPLPLTHWPRRFQPSEPLTSSCAENKPSTMMRVRWARALPSSWASRRSPTSTRFGRPPPTV